MANKRKNIIGDMRGRARGDGPYEGLGRPAKEPEERADKHIGFRLTQAEYEALQRLAVELGEINSKGDPKAGAVAKRIVLEAIGQ